MHLPFRFGNLPYGWYFCNGVRYGNDTPQGQALAVLPTEYKTDWGITTTGAGTNVPTFFVGSKGYFIRSVNGTTRLPGNVEQDAMRQITATGSASGGGSVTATGTFAGGTWDGNALGGTGFPSATGVFTDGEARYAGGGDGSHTWYSRPVTMNISAAIPNPSITVRINQTGTVADENRSLNIGMTPSIYLGA